MNVKGRTNRLFQWAAGFIRENTEISIFFFFFTSSLFLGDGKQPFVDVWWALGILTMYGIRHYQRGKLDLQPPPRTTGFLWMALIIYFVILIPFSDSAGYSISATIRLIEGYLVYVLFLTLARDSRNQGPPDSGNQTLELFIKGLLIVGVVATLASFVFLLSPSLARLLPPMNLLYANYGHNHLADLLLFIFPVAIGLVEKNQAPVGTWRGVGTIGLLVLFTIGMILTFARGAWVLLVFYLLFLVIRSKSLPARRVGLSVAAATVAAFLIVSLVSLRGAAQGSGFMMRLASQTQKPSLLQDGRWEYWRQAVEAIRERPLFGSGPGTFYLESKRLQSRSSSWSWFAHSFPLQTTTEIGFVGTLIFLFLIYIMLREAWFGLSSTKDNDGAPLLLSGAVLVFFYGFFEFTMDYVAVWILLCATLGLLIEHDASVHKEGSSRGATEIALIVLAAFYFSSLSSIVATAANNKSFAFGLAPYNAGAAKDALASQGLMQITAQTGRILAFFHKANPEIFSLLAAAENDVLRKARARETLIEIDPWGKTAFEVARNLILQGSWDRAGLIISSKQGHEENYAERKELSGLMLDLGDGLYKAGRWAEAGQWYMRAQEEDAWALNRHEPAFLQFRTKPQEALFFFDNLIPTSGNYLGKYRDAYAHEWLSALVETIRSGESAELAKRVRAIGLLAPWMKNQLWKDVGLLLVDQSKNDENNGNYSAASEKALLAFTLYHVFPENLPNLDWELRKKASIQMMELGNVVASRDLIITEKLQEAAMDVVSWVGRYAPSWYEDLNSKKTTAELLMAYLDSPNSKAGNWANKSRTYAAILLIEKLIDGGRPKDIYSYAKQMAVVNEVNYERRKNLVVRIQNKIDSLLFASNVSDAEHLVQSMKFILPDDYWVQAQEGYFYLVVGNVGKAKEAFVMCTTSRPPGHKDCTLGLGELYGTSSSKTRYQQISSILQKKKRWQDFTR